MASAWKRSRSGLIAALIVAGLLVLYPFSIGPTGWMANRGLIGPRTWSTIYGPVIDLSIKFGIDEPLLDYVDWWTGVPKSRGN